VLSAIGWGGAVAIGLTLRNMAILRSATEEVRSAERMKLARELHDVVAHHVTGIVVQAQAARVVVPHPPAVINEALIAIERAGEDALSAMRRMVGCCATKRPCGPVCNDGVVGGNRSFGGGYGLVGMAERVAALGGDLHAAPGADHTWVVTAGLPLTAKRGWT